MSEPSPVPESDAALGRRAQILATEHWGLLAARSTAQSEVLTRITIFLTLVSAGLITIGLLGQASDFSDWFTPAMLAILGFLCFVGFVTAVRVMNVAEEDMMYVIAMNRLRGAYVDLDPGIEQYFLASTTMTVQGWSGRIRSCACAAPVTCSAVRRCCSSSSTAASSGCSPGRWWSPPGRAFGWAIVAGVLVGLALVFGFGWYSNSSFVSTWRRYVPRRPTPPGPPSFLKS